MDSCCFYFRNHRRPFSRCPVVDIWKVRICYGFGRFADILRMFGTSIWDSEIGARNSKKRLARIRTLARLRRSVHGFEAVAITTPPPPRLRVKGVRFEVICKRTLEVDVVFDTQLSYFRVQNYHVAELFPIFVFKIIVLRNCSLRELTFVLSEAFSS